MTAINLLTGLANALQAANKDYHLTDERVAGNKLICKPGYLKIKTAAEENLFPHIIPRFVQGRDEEDGESAIAVRIFFGTYCEDVDTGWQELYNLMETSRIYLLTHRTIANRYRLIMPVSTYVVEPEPYPQWLGYMDVSYSIPQPREELNI